MPVFFPVGIQLSTFLSAQYTTVFNRLEGKMQQENVIYLPFSSSSCTSIWENILQEKNHGVDICQQAHDGLLQSYQHRGTKKLFYYNTYKN